MNFDFSYLDMAFKNGKVITVNENDDICEAVGIKKNKIVFVGSNKDIEKLIDDNTKVYDLKGRTLMPGLIDSHIHPILMGLIRPDLESPIISLFGDNAKSVEEILDKIKEAAKLKKPGEWISMWGYEPSLLKENRGPPPCCWKPCAAAAPHGRERRPRRPPCSLRRRICWKRD